MSEAALQRESSKAESDSKASKSPPAEGKSELDLDAVREGKGRAETGRAVGNAKQKSASVHIKNERCRDITDPEGSIHQRSRSNEIDYVSLRSDTVKGSAFRSPPGSMQTFKPLGGAHKENNQDPLQDTPTMVSHTDSSDHGSCSSPNSDATVTTEEGVSHKAAAGGRIETSGGQGEPAEEEERTGKRFSWLKDFDSSLWSNYFTSDSSRYSDC